MSKCKFCGRYFNGGGVGAGYCSKKCQIGDLGRDGAQEENDSMRKSGCGCAVLLIVCVIGYFMYSSGKNEAAKVEQQRIQVQREAEEQRVIAEQEIKEKRLKADRKSEIDAIMSDQKHAQKRKLSTRFSGLDILDPIRNELPSDIYSLSITTTMYYDGAWKTPYAVNLPVYFGRHKNDTKNASVLEDLCNCKPEYQCSALVAGYDKLDISKIKEIPTKTKTYVYYLFFERELPPEPVAPEKPNIFGRTFAQDKFEAMERTYRNQVAQRDKDIAENYNLRIRSIQTSLNPGNPRNGDIMINIDIKYLDPSEEYVLYANFSNGKPEPLNFTKNGYAAYYIRKQ